MFVRYRVLVKIILDRDTRYKGTKIPRVVMVEKGLTRYGQLNKGYGLYLTHHKQLAP